MVPVGTRANDNRAGRHRHRTVKARERRDGRNTELRGLLGQRHQQTQPPGRQQARGQPRQHARGEQHAGIAGHRREGTGAVEDQGVGAVAAGAGLIILGWAEFDATKSGAELTPQAISALKAVVAWAPSLGMIGTGLMLWFIPISHVAVSPSKAG